MTLRFDINSGTFVEVDEKRYTPSIVAMAQALGGIIKGDKGEPGSVIHSGNAPPANTVGVDGDFYIDSGTMFFYGPKQSDWGNGVCLLGMDGRPGKDGADGRDGLDGRDGIDGKDGAPGRDGVDGKNGQDGAPGRDGITPPSIELQTSATHVQFRQGQGEWRNLFEIPKNKTLIGGGGGRSTANIQAAINASLASFRVNLASGVTGILPQANGGTGYNSNYNAYFNLVTSLDTVEPPDFDTSIFTYYDGLGGVLYNYSFLAFINLLTAQMYQVISQPIAQNFVDANNTSTGETTLYTNTDRKSVV